MKTKNTGNTDIVHLRLLFAAKKKKKTKNFPPTFYYMQVQQHGINIQKLIRLDNKIIIKITLLLPRVTLCTYP